MLRCWVHTYLHLFCRLHDPFIIIKWPPPLVSWSVLCDVSIVPLLSFGFHLCEMSFSVPSLRACVCPWIWRESLHRQHLSGSYFFIHPVTVPFDWRFSPFAFRVTYARTYWCRLIVFWLFCPSLLLPSFVNWWLCTAVCWFTLVTLF